MKILLIALVVSTIGFAAGQFIDLQPKPESDGYSGFGKGYRSGSVDSDEYGSGYAYGSYQTTIEPRDKDDASFDGSFDTGP